MPSKNTRARERLGESKAKNRQEQYEAMVHRPGHPKGGRKR